MTGPSGTRRLSAGVEMQVTGAASVRVWAPSRSRVEFTIDGGAGYPLARDEEGFFAGTIRDVSAGTRYWFTLDGALRRPDPASRFQPDGPHGPSEIVDPLTFRWTDADWTGVVPTGQVLYEMHVGTFTPEGTWRAAMAELPALADLGVTVLEMMPVADFAGQFGWGYDGVNLYAPTRLYGSPDDLRAFVDRAHALGVGVILDVVYNHLGPDGNSLADFSTDYFTDRYTNDWGQAINFEGPQPARAFFVENAGYWIREFHFDGLRLDATQDIKDASSEHVVVAMARSARAAAGDRRTYIIAENEPQDTRLVRDPEGGGFGLDALWNDDYHHCTVVALTGRREAYYTDYKGSVQELISCAKYGYLYQGQWYGWQKQRRGTSSLDLPPHTFIAYMENHDQVANSAFGRRLHQLSSPARYRALAALTLLGPATPMLFQGQEFSSTAPFLYFADHREELRTPIRKGRREFLQQFASLSDPDVLPALPSPVDRATFERCKLDLSERQSHPAAYAMHRDLLDIRRKTPAISHPTKVDGAVIAAEALVLRYFCAQGDCLLVVNLGCDLLLTPAPEPLLAPPAGSRWSPCWSSETVRYGGQGTAPLHEDEEWHIPGEAAVLFSPIPRRTPADGD
ncbi:MAG: malto-oligosyltrehalose trehalohydrolase [Acidobacteriota bacterium]|nr:malto-oligosyltrehalose trehalohydrolase [Acidobacteriota bacterium]